MLYPIHRFFLHFGEYISNYFRGVVGSFLGARDIDSDEGELGPGKGMVEVVLQKIILWQICDVGGLDVGDISGSENADIH